MKNLLTLYSSILCAFISFGQQDPHFSNWNVANGLLNPAAVATESDLSAFTNFRMQWLPIGGPAFRTNAFAAEAKFGQRLDGGNFGTGIHFYNDQTGDSRVMTNMLKVPLNYAVNLNRSSQLSLGVTAGLMFQSFGGNQTWDNQWNGSEFDQGIESGENASGNFMSFDMGAGIYYHMKQMGGNRFHAGFAVDHLLAPNISLIGRSEEYFRKMTLHFGGQIELGSGAMALSPNFYGFKQGPNYTAALGNTFIFHIKPPSQRTDFVSGEDFKIGLYYRWLDAVIIRAGYRLSGLEFGAAYDANLSSLTPNTKSFGAFELFLKYSISYSNSSFNFRRF